MVLKFSLLIWLFTCLPTVLFSQSTLKGHLLDAASNSPIRGAKMYILGGDVESETTYSGQYRLDLSINQNINLGDEIDIYIVHPMYGFNKVNVPITSSYTYDIKISLSNIIKIVGTVIDNSNKEPIKGIQVTILGEEAIYLSDYENILTEETDNIGGYSFSISKNILNGQRYATLKFFDPSSRYQFSQKIVHIGSPQNIYLVKSKTPQPNQPPTNSKSNKKTSKG